MRKLSSILLCAAFIVMQSAAACNLTNVDTGLGAGNGGAVINNATGGLVDVSTGSGQADLLFNGNTHVNWNTLNVNKGETLNFNTTSGTSGITVLNTVNQGMSKIYGAVNSDNGISNLIISNPNGVLFDGAHFTTAGDLMVTTKDMSNVSLNDLASGQYTKLYQDGKLIPVQIQNGSVFEVGGDYTIMAAGVSAANSTITADSVKLITANGQDYLALANKVPTKDDVVTRLTAMTINGDLYVTNDVGAMETVSGGTVNGNTKILTSGNVILNKDSNGKKLNLNGDVDVKGNGAQMFIRNTNVDGNLYIANGGGFLDAGNINVTKDAKLVTKNVSTNNYNNAPIKHFVHVIGNSNVGGNLTIESENNIHIGGYNYSTQTLSDGNLTVGGDLVAHARNGHVMTTINTTADKISMVSDNYNILTDGKAVLSANEYEFSANGYIGGLQTTPEMRVDEKVVNIMENYIPIPNKVGTPGYINITGGTISNIENPDGASAYIKSSGDVKLAGANAGYINITAPNKYIEIAGNDVHADTITVGKETDKLKVEFPNRDYTLKYTNIRDAKEVTIRGNEEVTYELTNGPVGYNTRNPRPNNTTYLVGPGAPVNPDDPVTPPDDPIITPVNPTSPVIPDDNNENIKVLRSFDNLGVDLNQVATPIAYAAELDDDGTDTGVRKNVDGSVTVVRAFPMIN